MGTTTWIRRSITGLALFAAGLGAGSLTPAAYADSPAPAKVHQRNLLRAHSFTDHGYARVTTYDNWEGPDGDFDLVACGMTRSDEAAGVVNTKFRMYVGAQTTGQQVVIQFRDRAAAGAYVRAYRDAVANCWVTTHDAVEFGRVHRPAVAGVTSARWWSTHTDQGWTRAWGTVSLVRTDDRVSVLTLYSTTSSPRDTMDVPALMRDLADRLPIR